MNRVNLRRFEHDYDTTWNAYFTDARLNVYSRYGGRDQGDPEARMSKPSLLRTMNDVLAIHAQVLAARTQGRELSRVDFPFGVFRNADDDQRQASGKPLDNAGSVPTFQPIPQEPTTPEDMSLLKKGHQGCVHCHQVREYSLLQAYHDGRFRRELLFPFPLPESLGLEIDRQHGFRAANIKAQSAAESAGLHPGDEVVQVQDVPTRSELDIRWALHRLPADASQVSVKVNRKAASPSASDDRLLQTITLNLPKGWRESELGWRKSSRSIPFDWGFRASKMTTSERQRSGVPPDGLAIHVLSVKPRGLAAAIDLKKEDIILELDGDRQERSLEQLRSDILRRYSPGDAIRLVVRRGEQTLPLSGTFPNWFTEETTVP